MFSPILMPFATSLQYLVSFHSFYAVLPMMSPGASLDCHAGAHWWMFTSFVSWLSNSGQLEINHHGSMYTMEIHKRYKFELVLLFLLFLLSEYYHSDLFSLWPWYLDSLSTKANVSVPLSRIVGKVIFINARAYWDTGGHRVWFQCTYTPEHYRFR